MFQNIFLSSLLCASLYAVDFETFLADSLEKSPLLKTNALSLEQVDENAKLLTRYKNPSLSLEASHFSADVGSSAQGYRAAISQPLRLWGVSDAREALGNAQKEQTIASVKLARANFIAQFSSLYAEYKLSVFTEELTQEELEIVQYIAGISKERYKNGTIARVKFIQASLDEKRVKNFLAQAKVAKMSAYYRLIGWSGVNEELNVDTDYSFILSKKNDTRSNAQVAFLRANVKNADANAEINTNKLEWVNLNAEFEQVPNQSITRVSVDIPLVIFNTKSQEKRIAKLESQKAEFITENFTQQVVFKLRKLQNSITRLREVEKTATELLDELQELLNMYEEGYKIANTNLIELQSIKNQFIKTKANLLNIKLKKELNIIEHNFLTGTYNE